MKKILQLCMFLSFLVFSCTFFSACSKKTGCPMNEQVHGKTSKSGKMKTKKGKSNLFPKDMRKGRK